MLSQEQKAHTIDRPKAMFQVWYHADCDDGFGAAWAAREHFKKMGLLHQVDFVPVKYGAPPPAVYGSQGIYIVDFSYPRKVLENLLPLVKSLTILDHHKTAEADLKDFPNAIFDMNRSGAVITWQFFSDKPVPLLLRYIQANDLWRHTSMQNTQAMIRYIRTVRRDFNAWDEMAATIETSFHEVMPKALAIEQYFQTQKNYIADAAHFINFGGEVVPVVNSNYVFCSEVCNTLCERHQTAFAMSWFADKEGKAIVSLRSTEIKIHDSVLHPCYDVSALAKKYGGGGHEKAAGFSMKMEEWLKVITSPCHFKSIEEAARFGVIAG